MPKFARPNIYNGRQSNQAFTGTVRAATLNEAEEGESPELYISPQVLADMGAGFVPAATTTVPGVVELATNAEAVTGTATTNLAIIPASLTARLAAPGAIGGTTPAAGSFTTLSHGKEAVTGMASGSAAGAAFAGTVALVAGTITVSSTAVTANSVIRLTCQALGTVTAPSALCASAKVTGTSFTILASQNTDTSTIFWEIIN